MKDNILEDHSLQLSKNDGDLTSASIKAILRAVKWSKIAFAIATAAFLLQIIAQVLIGKSQAGLVPGYSPLSILFVTLFFIVLLYGYPIYKFINFLNQTPKGIKEESQEKFVEGITSLKSSIKYIAIFIFTVLILYIFIVLFALVFGGTTNF